MSRSFPSLRLALGALLSVGCHKLPESVPFEASLSVFGATGERPSGDIRSKELVGLDLKLDGKSVAKIEYAGGPLRARWSVPKAAVLAPLDGKYSVTIEGPCGPMDVPITATQPPWRGRTESELAKSMKTHSGSVPVFLDLKLPTRQEIYVDWENASGAVKVARPPSRLARRPPSSPSRRARARPR